VERFAGHIRRWSLVARILLVEILRFAQNDELDAGFRLRPLEGYYGGQASPA